VDRRKAIVLLVLLLLAVTVVAAFRLAPKRCTVGERMPQAMVLWHGEEAFVFVTINTIGRSRNILQDKLSETKYGYLALMFGGYMDFTKQDVIVYRVADTGKLDRFPLADRTTTLGSWSLADGNLQLTPLPGSAQGTLGFRWDGVKFVSVPASPQAPIQQRSTPSSTLSADDDDQEDTGYGFLDKTARQQFKDTGWHYKFLNGYNAGGTTQATLPVSLTGNNFNLTIESSSFKQTDFRGFDPLSYGTKSLQLSGDKIASEPQILWSGRGWQPISREDYDRLKQQYGHRGYQSPNSWGWLVVVAVLFLWRFGSWLQVLFTFATVKRRVLNNMATSFSFPPATPAQFPLLDLDALERYTRELEGTGFTRLLDFSLVSNSPTNPPSFCRLFAHTRHHCFAVASQFFPKGNTPLPLKISLESSLQSGWTLNFADRKPQATGSLLRRRRALGVCMPEATTSELLQAFLKMRDQVCLDLGISPLNDDTLEAYIQRTQRSIAELRSAVQEKNFVKGLPEVYLRKFSLLKTKPEYIWLGDYPKEAEQRQQGLGSFAAGAR
jgi:hypothetical protein